jgi:hypothetical protein
MITRGLTEVDGVFKVFDPDVKEALLLKDRTVAINNGSFIQWYKVADSIALNGLSLDNGLFINPIPSGQVVLPYTVDGEFVAGGAINQITDSGAFTIPLASSVMLGTILVAELPRRYGAFTPTASASGADEIIDESGADPDGVISWAGPTQIKLTSDGVSAWSL